MTFEGLSAACESGYDGRIKYDPGLRPQAYRVPNDCDGLFEGQVSVLEGHGGILSY